MKIAVIGKGNVGGGLAKLWRAVGHEVKSIVGGPTAKSFNLNFASV